MARWWPYIRLYTNWLENPKVAMLAPALQLGWLKLVTEAGKRGGALPQNLAEVAFTLRWSVDEVRSALADLEKARLFEQKDGRWTPHDYDDWQVTSDYSTPRVQKHRKAKRRETVSETGSGSVSETPNATVTETALQDKKKRKEMKIIQDETRTRPEWASASGLQEFIDAYPKKTKRDATARAYISTIQTSQEHDRLMAGLHRWMESDQWTRSLQSDGGRFVPDPNRFISERRYLDEPAPKQPEDTGANDVIGEALERLRHGAEVAA